MKKLIKYIPVLLLSLFIVSSCEESPESVQETLFGDESAAPQLSFNTYLSYDTGGNYVANWNELIGLDMTVSNPNEFSISDISIYITSIVSTSYVTEYSTSADPATISLLSAFDSEVPSFYWCFDCNTTSEIRIGNFYFVTTSSAGTVDLDVNFRATYTYDSREYTQDFTETITIF